MSQQVIIIGGGLAGLAAASGLAGRGCDVTLLESRPRLGGRAASVVDVRTGETIDNCQHVAMDCCTNFAHFCRMHDLGESFETQRELTFLGPHHTSGELLTARLRSTALPAPLHLAPAFARFPFFTLREKCRIAAGLRRLARAAPGQLRGMTFSQWLGAHDQPQRVVDRFWSVILVSALSETVDRIDAAIARKVFVDGFLSNRHGWTVQLPVRPLDDIYGDVAARLTCSGVDIRLKSGVSGLIVRNGRVESVRLRSGETLEGDQFVLAVSFDRVLDSLPSQIAEQPSIAEIGRLEAAPIASVHVWFDRPITGRPHVVFVDQLCQWLFARPSPPGDASTYYYQIVISAARDVAARPRKDVVQDVVSELERSFPDAQSAQLVHSRVLIEHKAVFAPTPESEALRLPQQSPIPNLQFAGDWTRTGWPATMEGAIRSGFLAAENVLSHLGRPAQLVQAELPGAVLSKLALRL